MAHGQAGNLMRFVRRFVAAPAGAAQTDRQLLELFASQRDEAAFAELVARHGPMVFNVARRVLDDAHAADDVYQAVFLVLARKAAALHWHTSVANWLYETAVRTALKAKTAAARRRTHEHQPAPPRNAPMPEPDWRELRAVLDEELGRLPAKYRTPVVLCYLEGKSNEEAAGLLGWPVGTVSGRLARARDLLRDRLGRRGLATTSAALGACLAQNALEAAVAPPLADTAVRAALVFTADAAGAGTIAAPITALTEGVLQAMFFHKLKVTAAVVLLATLVTVSAGLLFYSASGQRAVAVPVETKPTSPAEVKAVNGLKMTLSADQAVTTLKPDGSNAAPLTLTLTFTNVSDRPLKLNTQDLWRGRHNSEDPAEFVRFTITGPDPASVRSEVRYFRALAVAVPENELVSEIKPGESWAKQIPILEEGGPVKYFVTKPGTYRFKADYTGRPVKGIDVWTGTLASNEVAVQVKEAGKAALKLTLSADKLETVMTPDGKNAVPVKLKLTFANTTDQPIKFNAYDLLWSNVKGEVTAPAGSVQVARLAADRIATPPKAEDFPEIKPGQSVSFDQNLAFPGSVPEGSSTFALYTVLKPGEFRIKFTYTAKAVASPFAKDAWTGELASNPLVITVKPAAK